MAAYLFVNNGLPIFDTTGDVITVNSICQPVEHIENSVNITTAYGFTNDGASPPIATSQPAMMMRVACLVYFMTSQEARTPQDHTTNPKFACTPGPINRKTIDYKTKA